MKLEIKKGSENYTCQVIKLPPKVKVPSLDNLVCCTHQGNDCLVSKDSNEEELYLFFPAECQISHEFLSWNNLYRHSELNNDKTKKGFFEDNRRVKTIKFKGVISSGFMIPLNSLLHFLDIHNLKVGDEFNIINDNELCTKYLRPADKRLGMSNPKTKLIDEIVDSKFAPEHMDTSHLMKNIHKLSLNDEIIVSIKVHGTSARYFNTLIEKKLTWKDKIAKFFGIQVVEKVYDYIAASRRVIKSVGFEELPDKNHFYTDEDLWSKVGKQYFEGKLNEGEAVYCEIIGKTYNGSPIQSGYTYGLQVPKVYIYRISNINPQGIEIDLSYKQMKQRSEQLGLEVCPEFFVGTVSQFITQFFDSESMNKYGFDIENNLNNIFYNKLLEKSSILDPTVVEEGFCIRVDKYPKPEIFKIKSKKFLLHEGVGLDKGEINIEDEENTV